MGTPTAKGELDSLRSSLRPYLPVALVVCLGFVLSLISFNVIRGRDRARLQAEVARRVNILVVAIERSIHRHLEALRATSGLFYASREVERHEFRAFAEETLTPNLAIQALEWAPLVEDSERASYEGVARREGLSDFQFTERDASGKLVRASRRSEYYPIYYVEPLKGNEDALGFDSASDRTRLEEMEKARDTGKMVATPRTTLVQAGGMPGFLVVQPIYRRGTSRNTLEERRKNIIGFTIGAFRIGDVVETSLEEADVKGFDFHLYDETALAGQRRIYDHHESVNKKGEPYRIHGEEEMAAAIQSGVGWVHKTSVGGRKWAFIFHPTEELLAAEGTWRAWGVLAGGILVTLMLGGYLLDTLRRGAKIEGLASELSETNAALHRVNRALTALSQFNKALVQAEEEESLIQDACRVISDVAGYRLAWVGYAEQDEAKSIRPAAQWGFEAGYLDTLNVSWADDDKGRGPSGKTVRTGRPTVVRNIQADPDYRLWRDEATRRGYASTIALPLSDGERVFGVLRLYASEPDAFDEDEVELLTELAADLEYGILALRAQVQIKRAEEQLRKLSLAVEQSPTTVLITDPEGVIEYVNPKFTKVTGYSLAEAVGQKPSILKSGQMAPQVYEDLWRTITTGKEWRGELLNKKKNGELYWDFASISSIKNELGEITHYLAVKENITERKRMEKELRESEELHRLTLSNISDAVFITDDAGAFVYICPNVDIIFGHSSEEVQGLGNIAALLGEGLLDNTRLKSVGEVPNIEREITDKFGNGHKLLVNVKSVSIKGGTVLYTCRDISERKRAEEELRKSESRYRALFEDSPISLWEEDFSAVREHIVSLRESGVTYFRAHLENHPEEARRCAELVQVTDVNRAGVELLGYGSKHELITSLNRVFREESYEVFLEELVALAEGNKVYEVDTPNRTVQGEEIYVSMRLAVVPGYEDTWSKVLVSFTDITARKRAEEELGRAHRELQEAYDTLQRAQATAIASEKLASLGRLTAGVSHEIRNPLNVISMLTYMMLQESEADSERAEDLQDVLVQTRRIEKITEDLLYVARHRSPEQRIIDLNDETRRVFSLLERELILQNVEVVLELQDGLPEVSADQDQLQQVIFNLLSNARDAMPEGGRLSLRTRAVETEGRDLVELRVEDTGPGIPPEILDKIFEPFFTTKPEGKGTGLGLPICSGIIEAHGGSIWAENIEGGGAAFIVRLPIHSE